MHACIARPQARLGAERPPGGVQVFGSYTLGEAHLRVSSAGCGRRRPGRVSPLQLGTLGPPNSDPWRIADPGTKSPSPQAEMGQRALLNLLSPPGRPVQRDGSRGPCPVDTTS